VVSQIGTTTTSMLTANKKIPRTKYTCPAARRINDIFFAVRFISRSQSPVHRFYSMRLQPCIAATKMPASEKSAVCGEGRGVGCCKHQMFAGINDLLFALGKSPPKHKYNVLFLV